MLIVLSGEKIMTNLKKNDKICKEALIGMYTARCNMKLIE